MHSSRLRMLALIAMTALGAIGCKQAVGQPCEVDSDCASNRCCGEVLSSPAAYMRGLCIDEGAACMTVMIDAGARDAGGTVSEAGMPDAGPDAGADAGTDAGTDAGALDAGTDAGALDGGA